ncbi:MAG: FMN-binding protein [Planctomycetes bacterium]|nr:FMN-binding protein [Planctomycetota bacterium]
MKARSNLRACVCLALLLLARAHAAARAEEQAPPKDERLQVTIYYSKDDGHWPEVEKAIEEAIEPFRKILRYEKVSIDLKEGYARLVRAEKDLNIAPSDRGEITAVIGHFALLNKGKNRRDIESYLARVLKRMLIQDDLKQRRKTDAEAYAKQMLGEKVTVKKETESEARVYYRVEEDGKFVGYVVDVYHVIWCPICADAQFLLAVNASLRIKDVTPVHELEVYGVPLEGERARKFLDQFKGRDPEKKVKTLDTVSGATKTSLAYDAAITEVLEELKNRAGAPAEVKTKEEKGKKEDR